MTAPFVKLAPQLINVGSVLPAGDIEADSATLRKYFDALYDTVDPYGTSSRWYERRKRQLLLDALPRERFRVCFEPACGTGELTFALAERCGKVFASDFCESAADQARRRTFSCHNVDIAVRQVPQSWPAGTHSADLIVISELCSFLSAAEVTRLALCSVDSLTSDGVLTVCDWRWPFEGRVLDAETAHGILDQAGLQRVVRHEEEDFLLSVWTRDGHSVARNDGILA